MAVKILEIHHTGVRVDDDAKLLADTQDFYADVLGLGCDTRSGMDGDSGHLAVDDLALARAQTGTHRDAQFLH